MNNTEERSCHFVTGSFFTQDTTFFDAPSTFDYINFKCEADETPSRAGRGTSVCSRRKLR